MSHHQEVPGVEMHQDHLGQLAEACSVLGTPLRMDRKEAVGYANRRWACDGVIEIPGCGFEVGVKIEHGGKVNLLADFYGLEGEILKKKLGEDLGLLKQQYIRAVKKKVIQKSRHRMTERKLDGGRIMIVEEW